MPCVELGDGRLLDESNSAAWLLSPDGMLGADEKAAQAEVTFFGDCENGVSIVHRNCGKELF